MPRVILSAENHRFSFQKLKGSNFYLNLIFFRDISREFERYKIGDYSRRGRALRIKREVKTHPFDDD